MVLRYKYLQSISGIGISFELLPDHPAAALYNNRVAKVHFSRADTNHGRRKEQYDPAHTSSSPPVAVSAREKFLIDDKRVKCLIAVQELIAC